MATAASSHIPPECSICFESFKTPKFITCGHTFCLECIDRHIGNKTETFPCPLCQQNVKIPEGGARMFTTNFALQTTTEGVEVSSTQSHISNIAGTPTSHTTEASAQSVSPVNHDCPYKKPVVGTKSCDLDKLGSVVTKLHDLGMSGSVVTKSQTTKVSTDKQNSFRFRLDKDKIGYYSKDKFSSNGIKWSCSVGWKSSSFLNISIHISRADNPKQDCSIIIDGQLSFLNHDDDSKTLTKSFSNQKLTKGCPNWIWEKAISGNKLIDKNNGYLTSNNQFIVQLDIKQIRDISFK